MASVSTQERDADLLRAKGLRVTAPRLAVLDALLHASQLTADDIAATVRAAQEVYDVLHTLTTSGLLRRIESAGSATRYERRVYDSHHHVVCRSCGAVRDVRHVTGAAPCLDPSETAGFAVDEAEITFWGTCPDCSTSERRTKTLGP